MGGKFTVEKIKDGQSFWQTLPFNPLSFGWRFIQACCCEVWFRKGGRVAVVIPGKNRMELCESKNMQIVSTHAMPKSDLEFLIKTDVDPNLIIPGTVGGD